MLSKSEINKFKNDGFVLIRELFSKNEVKTLIKYTEELQNSPEISGREWKFFEESKLNKKQKVLARIENFCKFHDGFNLLCT